MIKPYLAPALCGLLIALVLTQLFPSLTGKQNYSYFANQGPYSYAEAANKAIPAVVNIFTTKVVAQRRHPLFDDPFFSRIFPQQMPKQRLQNSLGSGVIMSGNGYVLTNNHVIAGADEIRVALSDGRETIALLVGSDPEMDLAVLKINLTDLPVMKLAEHKMLNIGDVVLAIGNPFGLGQTVTQGIVSATGRRDMNLSSLAEFIQTDAAINQGNSGGALVNARGELVGINTAILSQSGENLGIGFAIPATHALKVLQDIAQYGQVVRGWLGVETQNLANIHPKIKLQYGFPATLEGLLVLGVAKNGPVDQAGLAIGDVITELDGHIANNPEAIRSRVAALSPGENIEMKVLRDGQLYVIKAEVGRK